MDYSFYQVDKALLYQKPLTEVTLTYLPRHLPTQRRIGLLFLYLPYCRPNDFFGEPGQALFKHLHTSAC